MARGVSEPGGSLLQSPLRKETILCGLADLVHTHVPYRRIDTVMYERCAHCSSHSLELDNTVHADDNGRDVEPPPQKRATHRKRTTQGPSELPCNIIRPSGMNDQEKPWVLILGQGRSRRVKKKKPPMNRVMFGSMAPG